MIFETESTCGSAFLAVAEGGRADRPQAKALGPLLACCVTCLVRVPQLLTVITKLCAAAIPAACNLWTAGTSKRYDCVSVKGKNGGHKLRSKKTDARSDQINEIELMYKDVSIRIMANDDFSAKSWTHSCSGEPPKGETYGGLVCEESRPPTVSWR